jgi:AcrR family transcriptional regulator
MKGTKELILKTAKKLFSRNGLTRTSMDNIADDAKIGKGTIYHYYDSKEQLFIEVAESEVEGLRKNLVAALSVQAGPEEKLRAYVLERIKLVGEVSKIFSMFKEEYDQYYSYIKRVEDKFNDFELTNIRQALVEGAEKNIFDVEDADFLAFAISRLIHSMEYFFGIEKDPAVVEKKVDAILSMLINGLRKR